MKARLASVLASVIISLALLGPIHGNASAEPQELPFRGHYAGAVVLQNGLMTLNGVGEATHLGRTSLSIVSSPRVGQEVVVNFLEGDPDHPIIVGNVYNAELTSFGFVGEFSGIYYYFSHSDSHHSLTGGGKAPSEVRGTVKVVITADSFSAVFDGSISDCPSCR